MKRAIKYSSVVLLVILTISFMWYLNKTKLDKEIIKKSESQFVKDRVEAILLLRKKVYKRRSIPRLREIMMNKKEEFYIRGQAIIGLEHFKDKSEISKKLAIKLIIDETENEFIRHTAINYLCSMKEKKMYDFLLSFRPQDKEVKKYMINTIIPAIIALYKYKYKYKIEVDLDKLNKYLKQD